MSVRVIAGDCRTEMEAYGPFDMLLADPPYAETALEWDVQCNGWVEVAARLLKPTGSLWVFGSMRFFQSTAGKFKAAELALAQDIVWEKHNGSSFHADRFKRVHEHVVQYYHANQPWRSVYNNVLTTPDAVARMVRRKRQTPHARSIESSQYVSEDGGPRLMRSVIYMRSMHGRAIHPTEKPSDLLEILIRTSCPPNGTVGDMFAGSGSGGEAAMRAGRNYIGFEIDLAMAKKASDRLGEILPLAMV
jgi:site-specific DNA-methyltransferase (adenine-specific)